MKKVVFWCIAILLIIGGCKQKVKESENIVKIENSLKSISFWRDSIGIDPAELLPVFEQINKSIDSIGYPDAGYKLWVVQGDSSKNFKYMIEGAWPDQETYNLIHNHKLFDVAARDNMMSRFKMVSYYRFSLAK